MKVSQVYDLVNSATKEVLGETAVLNEDLSNVVDFGTALFDATTVDNYVKNLVDRIGKVIFVNRPYTGFAPKILMDSWEFGSVLEKIDCDMFDAKSNETWELNDGTVYEQQQFYKPKVTVKFYNSKNTFEIPVSIAERQVKESFTSASQLNAFVSMIYNKVDTSMTVRIDKLIMETITAGIGEVINKGTDGLTKINLLKDYNAATGAGLTAAKALSDPDFLRYASLAMKLTVKRTEALSTLFNLGKKPRFTPAERRHLVLLNEFKEGIGTYLYDANGQFNTDNLKLMDAETVPYWQGSGTDYAFKSTSKIDVKLQDGTSVSQDGILGVLFDNDALAVCNTDRRVTTAPYNAVGEFWNNYYKFDCQNLVDTNENIVVFYVKDEDGE